MSRKASEGKLTGTREALEAFLSLVYPVSQTETIDLEDADNRALGKAILAPVDYPHYDQCIVDGYAVKAEDTTRCTEGLSRVLPLSGEGAVLTGTCQTVHTGSALPPGADAVVMIEHTVSSPEGITLQKEARKGDWIWPKGAGIRKGNVVYDEGRQLKPTDVAMLAKIGVSRVEVYKKPRVLILPTGDEVIARDECLSPGIVYESNGLMCQMLIKRYGGEPVLAGIIPDNPGLLEEALREGAGYDLIVTIGGSSGGKRDLMAQAIAAVGKVTTHGIAFHPGNHAGTGYLEIEGRRTPIVFLPGYTESCAVAMFTLVEPAVRKLGRLPPRHIGRSGVVLTGGYPKPQGIRKVIKVRVIDGQATPVKLIGEPPAPGEYAYVVIPENIEGYTAGEKVECRYLE